MDHSWQNLPPHVFDSIFSNFSVRELKTFSLVSRSWLQSIDTFWRKNILFYTYRLENDDDLKVLSSSQRYFVNFRIGSEAMDDIDMVRGLLQILKDREEDGNPPHIEYLEVPLLDEIFEILRNVGSSLKTLIIDGGSPDITDEVSLQNLSSVERLSVIEVSSQFFVSPEFFKSLVYLRLDNDRVDLKFLEFLKTLTTNNKYTLESLSITLTVSDFENTWSISDFEFFGELKKLKHFSIENTTQPEMFRAMIKNPMNLESLKLEVNSMELEDFVQIKTNFQSLKSLAINRSEDLTLTRDCWYEIWSLENLLNLKIDFCFYSKNDLLESLRFKILKLEKITLNEVYFDDDLASTVFRKCPFLKEFKLFDAKDGKVTFRLVQEAADHLRSLEVLDINSNFLNVDDNLKNNSVVTQIFQNLKSLKLPTLKTKFLKEIKAPNLKKIDFANSTEIDEEGLKKVCENCPLIEDLDLYNTKVTDSGINEVSLKLKFLKILCCHVCESLTLDAVASVVENCKYLQDADFGYIFKRDDDESFEKRLHEIRILRNPPLNFHVKRFEEIEGFGKYKLITDSCIVRLSNDRKRS
ncbi:hypothetical protein ACFFRR_010559 [Megaselia abdita]